jgi:hypothetical protein
VFNEMGYEIIEFPESVINQEQNISVKFTPIDLDLELITRFSVNKTFDEAYRESEEVEVKGQQFLSWKVLSYNDLISSKLKANRPKDLLDIKQLQKLRNKG